MVITVRNPIICYLQLEKQKNQGWDFPGGPVVKNLPQNAGDVD